MFKRIQVSPFQKALVIRDGRLVRVLDPGAYWIRGAVIPVDLRRKDTVVDVAPVRTREMVPVGIRLRVSYRVSDASAVFLRSVDPRSSLENDATASVHRVVSTVPVAELAVEHNRLEFAVLDRLRLEASSYGLRVEDVAIVQVRLPRALRRKAKRMEVTGPV